MDKSKLDVLRIHDSHSVGVLFHVALKDASELIERFIKEYVSHKLIILGSEIGDLGALNAYWRQYIDVVTVTVPNRIELSYEVLAAVLDSEGISANEVVWISRHVPPIRYKDTFQIFKMH